MVARAMHSRRCGAEVLPQQRMRTRSGTARSLLMQA